MKAGFHYINSGEREHNLFKSGAISNDMYGNRNNKKSVKVFRKWQSYNKKSDEYLDLILDVTLLSIFQRPNKFSLCFLFLR